MSRRLRSRRFRGDVLAFRHRAARSPSDRLRTRWQKSWATAYRKNSILFDFSLLTQRSGCIGGCGGFPLQASALHPRVRSSTSVGCRACPISSRFLAALFAASYDANRGKKQCSNRPPLASKGSRSTPHPGFRLPRAPLTRCAPSGFSPFEARSRWFSRLRVAAGGRPAS